MKLNICIKKKYNKKIVYIQGYKLFQKCSI